MRDVDSSRAGKSFCLCSLLERAVRTLISALSTLGPDYARKILICGEVYFSIVPTRVGY